MADLSRRQFLGNTLLTAAVAASPTGLFRHRRASAPVYQVPSKSPNEILGVAVVGVRGQGNNHIKAYLGSKQAEILYIADVDEEIGQKRAEEVAKEQKRKPKWVRDMREAFADKSVDTVSIATPNFTHGLAAVWAMQAGKDVYLEKPVSFNIAEGRAVVEASHKLGRICQIGTQCRSNGGIQEAIRYVHSGKIGEVKLSRGLCYKRRKSIGPKGVYQVPKSVDYNLWSGPVELLPLTRKQFHYDWHWQWPYGNGDLVNQGIHQMDIARWGLGENTSCSRVCSYGGRWGYEDSGETPNSNFIFYEYPDGKTMMFEVRGLETKSFHKASVGVVFHGTDGYVVVTSYKDATAYDKNWNVVRKFTGGTEYDLSLHIPNFFKAVRSRKMSDLNAPAIEGHLSTALCHLGNISYRLGKTGTYDEMKSCVGKLKTNENVADLLERFSSHLTDNELKPEKLEVTMGAELIFDPKTETFPGNDAANAFLARECRKPFVIPAAKEFMTGPDFVTAPLT